MIFMRLTRTIKPFALDHLRLVEYAASSRMRKQISMLVKADVLTKRGILTEIVDDGEANDHARGLETDG